MIEVKRKTINSNNPTKTARLVIIADVNGKNTTVYVDYTGDQDADEVNCMNKLMIIEGG